MLRHFPSKYLKQFSTCNNSKCFNSFCELYVLGNIRTVTHENLILFKIFVNFFCLILSPKFPNTSYCILLSLCLRMLGKDLQLKTTTMLSSFCR